MKNSLYICNVITRFKDFSDCTSEGQCFGFFIIPSVTFGLSEILCNNTLPSGNSLTIIQESALSTLVLNI